MSAGLKTLYTALGPKFRKGAYVIVWDMEISPPSGCSITGGTDPGTDGT